jgi:hypothetical protein
VPTRKRTLCRRVSTPSGEPLSAESDRTGRRGLTRQDSSWQQPERSRHEIETFALPRRVASGSLRPAKARAPNASIRERVRGEHPSPNLARRTSVLRALLFSGVAHSIQRATCACAGRFRILHRERTNRRAWLRNPQVRSAPLNGSLSVYFAESVGLRFPARQSCGKDVPSSRSPQVRGLMAPGGQRWCRSPLSENSRSFASIRGY